MSHDVNDGDVEDVTELEHDPLPEELRQLYRRLQPPRLAEDASEADPETARVVQWMQSAWRGLEIPPARVPLVRRARLRHARFVLAAAAAVLFLVGGAALWRALDGDPRPAPAPRVAEGPARPGASRVEFGGAGPGRLELRSGPVRLVLLDPPHTTLDPETTEDPTGG